MTGMTFFYIPKKITKFDIKREEKR